MINNSKVIYIILMLNLNLKNHTNNDTFKINKFAFKNTQQQHSPI
jgi:hypothetical protein